jgi:hypothetical protein
MVTETTSAGSPIPAPLTSSVSGAPKPVAAAVAAPAVAAKPTVQSATAIEIGAIFTDLVNWGKAHAPTILAFAAGFVAGFLLR